MQIFAQVFNFSEFLIEIESVFPSHNFHFDQVDSSLKEKIIIVYPKDEIKFSEEKKVRLLDPTIHEFSTQEIIYKAIYNSLVSPSSSILNKNIISYGFRIQNENQSKNIYNTFDHSSEFF